MRLLAFLGGLPKADLLMDRLWPNCTSSPWPFDRGDLESREVFLEVKSVWKLAIPLDGSAFSVFPFIYMYTESEGLACAVMM